MYIETLFDQVEEQSDSELLNRAEYQKRNSECDSCMDMLYESLSSDQQKLFFDFEAAMNHRSAYVAEFYFWKGYERGMADKQEKYDLYKH